MTGVKLKAGGKDLRRERLEVLHFFIQVVEDLREEEIGQKMIQGREAFLTLKGLSIDEVGLVQ